MFEKICDYKNYTTNIITKNKVAKIKNYCFFKISHIRQIKNVLEH